MAELKEYVRTYLESIFNHDIYRFLPNVWSVVSGQKQYPVKSKPLWMPSLEELVPHVESALRENYSNVKVRKGFDLY